MKLTLGLTAACVLTLAARTGAHSTPSFYIDGGLLQGAPLLDSVYAARTRPR